MPERRKAYIPVAGGHLNFDAQAILNDSDGKSQVVVRKVEPPKGPWLDRMMKFAREEETMACLMRLPPISFELEVRLPTDDAQANFGFILPVLRLIPIKTGCVLETQCWSTHSFAAIDQAAERSIILSAMEATERSYYRYRHTITKDDVQWVEQHYKSFLSLFDEQRFVNASNALDTFAHSPYASAGLLTLWSGFEALFGIDTELRFRVSLLAAFFLEAETVKRKELYDALRKCYDLRSAVVHGSVKSGKKEAIHDHAVWIAKILRRLLLKCVEQGSLPVEADVLFS